MSTQDHTNKNNVIKFSDNSRYINNTFGFETGWGGSNLHGKKAVQEFDIE